MSNKGNKGGFSGLSDLTSDSDVLQHAECRPSTNSLPSQNKLFALIPLINWPSFPAPWSSSDAGETWIWGNFFFIFQKEPDIAAAVIMKMNGGKPKKQALKYHYAMIAFYRLDRNPHGPSHQPIMAVGLEQTDMSMVGAILGKDMAAQLQAEGVKKMGPLMIGLFTAEKRSNLGHYEGDTSPQAVKKVFFEIFASLLPVSGQPKKIGSLVDAHGHPETGLPAQKKKSGCAPVLLLFVGICGLAVWALAFV